MYFGIIQADHERILHVTKNVTLFKILCYHFLDTMHEDLT
jgi:hypothetical protein